MKNLFILVFITFTGIAQAQTTAWNRVKTLGLGSNLSYLDNYWNGSIAKHHGDYVKMADVLKRKSMLADIAKTGMKSVRIPMCFSASASLDAPYYWDYPQNLPASDSLINWALANNLKVIIDFHHPEMDLNDPRTTKIERIEWLWTQIAQRYKNLDPDKVFFELWNEPHDIQASDWRIVAERLIALVRKIAPKHTLVVGFHDWNGRDALISSQPFADDNIIYTFHYYDPFVFTHQGATWTTGLEGVKNVPFPAQTNTTLSVPASAKGTWIENALKNYANEANTKAMSAALQKVKLWSDTQNKPIYLGEFGSYGFIADAESRCNHAFTVMQICGILEIPISWWEWDGGFNMFEKGTTRVSDCMMEALKAYSMKATNVESLDKNDDFVVYPNPSSDAIQIKNTAIKSVQFIGTNGQLVQTSDRDTEGNIQINKLPVGVYILRLYDAQNKEIGTKKLIKRE